MELENLIEKINIGEDYDLECKASQDKLTNDIWKTVSAFANTNGGYIILGITEKKHKFTLNGVNNSIQQKKDFWSTHNNPQKLNFPICRESDITITQIDEKEIVIIKVPQANRTQRPIYINNNPITGTYKRNFDGDYLCREDEVQQMLRDKSNEPQDYQILDNFEIDDLDPETLKAFRQRFSNREPDHLWLALDDRELLYKLGGYKKDRNTDKQGLTLAGLLMFGRESSILEAFPRYHLDYQEKRSHDPEERWTYRITLDGKWEANLFNFYYRVYGRLVNDLDVPFKLDRDSVSQGETHVHQALREALVNSLIHADHSSTRPLTIVKSQDVFLFSNPGRLRIPIDKVYEGGVSDPRNPKLQKMFQMVGLGEKAGSGFPKILRAWKEQEWLIPLVSEKLDLDMTTVALPMIGLIPENVEKELREVVGDNYCNLSELDRIILVLAHKFEKISNSDIQRYSQEHRTDIGDCLKHLVDNGWLKKSGHGRWTYYTLPNNTQADLFSLSPQSDRANCDHLDSSSDHLQPSSDHLDSSSDHWEKLIAIAKPVRDKGNAPKKLVEQTILELCQDRYLTQQQLAEILNRSPITLRTSYLSRMIQQKSLQLKYPDKPTHPDQGYQTYQKS